MDYLMDIIYNMIRFLPFIAGAYVIILIFRFADLTLEASWNIGAISTCLIASGGGNIFVSPFVGALTGMMCGGLTWLIFICIGKGKFLSGIISYFMLIAVGYHLLGNNATVNLERNLIKFGIQDNDILYYSIYGIYVTAALLVVYFWQYSKIGIKCRLIGENPLSAKYYNYSLNLYYGIGLVLGNAIVGLGGGLWALNFGYASNVQGIGMVINAFLALLTGQRILYLLGCHREVPLIITIGTLFFVFIKKAGELVLTQMKLCWNIDFIKPSDSSLFIGVIILLLLCFTKQNNKDISEW